MALLVTTDEGLETLPSGRDVPRQLGAGAKLRQGHDELGLDQEVIHPAARSLHELARVVGLGDDVGIGPARSVQGTAGDHLLVEALRGRGLDSIILDVGDGGRLG